MVLRKSVVLTYLGVYNVLGEGILLPDCLLFAQCLVTPK